MSIQALREQLSHENRAAKALLESKGDRPWTKEEQGKFDELMDEAERVENQIEAAQRLMDDEADDSFRNVKKKEKRLQLKRY